MSSRLSLNQATTTQWDIPALVDGCARAGLTQVGLWRGPVADYGLDRTAKLVRDAGLTVTSLCRGGFFADTDAIADNRKAIDEAAALGAPILVLVSGGLPPGSQDIDAARQNVLDSIAELAPYAAAQGVQLSIEPLHPMFASDRCVVSTLDQALDMALLFPANQVGVCVDTYHVWWDPGVYQAIERAAERISIFQVCDWITPLPEGVLLGRGMMGDGCIELRRLREAVDATGYSGPIEVEIFNQAIWDSPGDEVVDRVIDTYQEHVL
ncbi:sugar phosphate isomerase [Actinosynnema sp. ALI-1.44]|uniref:sugar phosphate isomerase/epimerase family protein n=1 Tax=Actinosynnema sp. ALI-1.44 TaxID=1933779 RepID=UPI00097C9810|nr:sugar phosphate isomerase/epimerase family protein [Actinosynnema sp. ALI-1.44]ONI70591.1 sugar phosphate isomerase [Actinosynnema sp. ALI-1.44]